LHPENRQRSATDSLLESKEKNAEYRGKTKYLLKQAQAATADVTGNAIIGMPIAGGKVLVSRQRSVKQYKPHSGTVETALAAITKEELNVVLARRRKQRGRVVGDPSLHELLLSALETRMRAMTNRPERVVEIVALDKFPKRGSVLKETLFARPEDHHSVYLAAEAAAQAKIAAQRQTTARSLVVAEQTAALQGAALRLVQYMAPRNVDVQAMVTADGTRYYFEYVRPAREEAKRCVHATKAAVKAWNALFVDDPGSGTKVLDPIRLQAAVCKLPFVRNGLKAVIAKALQPHAERLQHEGITGALNAFDTLREDLFTAVQQSVATRFQAQFEPALVARAKVAESGLSDSIAVRVWRAPLRRTKEQIQQQTRPPVSCTALVIKLPLPQGPAASLGAGTVVAAPAPVPVSASAQQHGSTTTSSRKRLASRAPTLPTVHEDVDMDMEAHKEAEPAAQRPRGDKHRTAVPLPTPPVQEPAGAVAAPATSVPDAQAGRHNGKKGRTSSATAGAVEVDGGARDAGERRAKSSSVDRAEGERPASGAAAAHSRSSRSSRGTSEAERHAHARDGV
jgi:hypothetical protein